jgi:hypothetical protein
MFYRTVVHALYTSREQGLIEAEAQRREIIAAEAVRKGMHVNVFIATKVIFNEDVDVSGSSTTMRLSRIGTISTEFIRAMASLLVSVVLMSPLIIMIL